jgi:hypothetical protein
MTVQYRSFKYSATPVSAARIIKRLEARLGLLDRLGFGLLDAYTPVAPRRLSSRFRRADADHRLL